MKNIKLFEDFILEVSSKKLEEINSHIKKMIEGTSEYDITWMLHYILAANINSDDEIKRISKKYDGYIQGILNDNELTFDMDKAIDNYKKLKEYNKGQIKTGAKLYKFIEETDFEKKTLEVIENILDYYKKNKKVESVDFHKFVNYIYKMLRVLKKTDKNSQASINNMLNVIVKNGIDILNIEKEIRKYEKEKEKDYNIKILTKKCLKAGELDGDERDNDSAFPVFCTSFWNDVSHAQITLSLFVQKKEYILCMGYISHKIETDIIAFNNKGEQTAFGNNKELQSLGNIISAAKKEFGENNFKKILEDIFEIFAKNGADVKFNYDDLMKNIKNFLK